MTKNNHVGIISLGTGGTTGHCTLISSMAEELSDSVSQVIILSEYDYQSLTSLKKNNVSWIKIPNQKHQQTLAGKLNYEFSSQIIENIKSQQLDTIIFSTFFDQKVTIHAKENNIACYLATYILRDTFENYFFLNNHQECFDKIFVTLDLLPLGSYQQKDVVICSPKKTIYAPKNKEFTSTKGDILISCGGGGRPSADKFFDIIEKIIPEINESYPSVNITISIGAFGQGREFQGKNTKVVHWLNNWPEHASDSDLVICEAGYFSVYELICKGVPGILIPGERRMDNQELRALLYQKNGLGYCVLPQEGASRVMELVDQHFGDPALLIDMRKNCQEYCEKLSSFPTVSQSLLRELSNKKK